MGFLAPAIGGIVGAGTGVASGVMQSDAQEAQRKADLKANALEARYAWTGNKPNYRQVTKPGSRAANILAGGMAGGQLGSNIQGGISKLGGASPTEQLPDTSGEAWKPMRTGDWGQQASRGGANQYDPRNPWGI